MAENTRRDFIKRSALGAAAMLVYPPWRVLGANDTFSASLSLSFPWLEIVLH
jgi:hypothetical protein